MANCRNCRKQLDGDDIGAYQKFIDRRATDFLCVACLSKELKCSETYLRERIEFLRRNGCGLFPPKKE